MKKSKSTKIIEQVALKNGVSVAHVREEMQKAINIAYENHAEAAGDFWKKWEKRAPTPEEFIMTASREFLEKVLK